MRVRTFARRYLFYGSIRNCADTRPESSLVLDLIIVTWGANVDKNTFKTTENGTVISVNLNTKEIAPYSKNVGNIGNLEGITKSNKNEFYITDWINGILFKINPDGVEEVLRGLKNPTAPNYSKEMNIITFPKHTGNRVIFLKLSE